MRDMKKIAVVTPYYRESIEVLRQCHESVRTQDVPAEVVHLMIADGVPNPAIDAWHVEHVRLPRAHGNNGNTPRAIGALLAEAQGCDFIAFLDADNWYHPGHLSSLLQLHETSRADICSSFRTFHRHDGSILNATEAGEDNLQHVDTSCLLLHRNAFPLNSVWSQMPNEISPICDRVFLKAAIHQRRGIASTRQRTVAFRTTYEIHYRMAGETPPEISQSKEADVRRALTFLMSADGVQKTVERLGFWAASW
jgi:glycosyltransferase involved in cell wall biosynthesis